MKRLIAVIVMSGVLFGVTACSGSEKPAADTKADTGQTTQTEAADEEETITLRYGNAAVSTAQSAVNAMMFKEKVEALSGGKIKVEYIGESALGDQSQHYAMIKEGTLDLMQSSFDSFGSLEGGEDFRVVLAPYVFNNLDHIGKFVESSLFEEMKQSLEQSNNFHIIGVCTYCLPRNLNSTRPVASVADAKALKIRVPNSDCMLASWNYFGAEPVVMGGGELYSALENGLVEAQDNDVLNSYAASMHEVAEYYTEIEYINQCYVMFITQPTWDRLTDQQKAWIEEACAQTCEEHTEQFLASGEEYKQKLIDAGVTFVEPDLESWKKAAEDFAAENDGTLWTEGLYQKIRDLDE